MPYRKTPMLFGAFVCAGFLSLSPQAQATIIVGGSTLNGNFNADVGTGSRTFTQTPSWVNIGTGGQGVEATLDTLPFDGTRNAVVSDGVTKVFGLDTGYNIASGDVFDLSYVWRDAFNWNDAADQIRVSLFITGDNTIGGSRTNLAQILSGLSTTNDTFELVDQNAIYTAVGANAGKRLFVEILGANGGGTGEGFARLDNFVLEVTSAPEPSSLVLFGLALVGCVVYCGIRRS